MNIERRAIRAPFLLVLLPVFASATTMTWSSYSAWTSNVTGAIELNFGGIAPISGSYNTAAGKTLYPASGPALPFIFTGPFSTGYQLTTGTYGSRSIVSFFGPGAGDGSITIALPTGGENAVLLGLGSTGSATSITVALSDGQTFPVVATPNGIEFLGLSLSHDINWIRVSAANQPVINDFYFAASKLTQDPAQGASTAFEGPTIFLAVGGLVTAFGLRCKTLFKLAGW